MGATENPERRPVFPESFHLQFTDDLPKLKSSVENVLKEDFDKMIVTHCGLIDKDAKQVFSSCFDWCNKKYSFFELTSLKIKYIYDKLIFFDPVSKSYNDQQDALKQQKK